MDVILSIPLLLLGLGVGAACSVKGCLGGLIEPGMPVIIFLIAFGAWPFVARIVRGLVLSMREREFVEASRALGASDRPDHVPRDPAEPDRADHRLRQPADPDGDRDRGGALVPRRSASGPPTASWGQMIADATPIFSSAWWYFTFPGLALLLTVLAFNLLGDGLQDALSPTERPMRALAHINRRH